MKKLLFAFAALLLINTAKAALIEYEFWTELGPNPEFSPPSWVGEAQGTLVVDTIKGTIETFRLTSDIFDLQSVGPARLWGCAPHEKDELWDDWLAYCAGSIDLTDAYQSVVYSLDILELFLIPLNEDDHPLEHLELSGGFFTMWLIGPNDTWLNGNHYFKKVRYVPEPSTLALLGLAISGLSLRRRLS